MKNKVKNFAKDPRIESHVKTFLKAMNNGDGPPMEDMEADEARKVLEDTQSSVETDISGIDVEEKTIDTDGLNIKLFIVRPAGAQGVLPVFMFFHGGGWVLGDFKTHQRMVRDLVVYSGLTCVFVEYTRSPEAKYPVALNECYAATKWVAYNGMEISVDSTRMAVVGNSAGGNLATAVALKAKDGGPHILFQLLFWPVTNADFETKSYRKYAKGRFSTRNMMMWFWDNYTSKRSHRKEIFASPLRASLEELKGMPPTLVQVAENDVLRDEGEAYARKLDQAGVPVTLVRIQGMIHDFGLLNPIAHVPTVKAVLFAVASNLRRVLTNRWL
jgi:acetyl esterase